MRLVLGVIGHVDHGKTALVRALTGTETDRLAEEKRRGISIALGFAHLALPAGTIDFIDMPGHERFVRTMVSGATGMDAALLVVAANEGIKPQTLEHLDIAALLGIQTVLIAVTKTDLLADPHPVASETAALVRRLGMQVAATVLTSVQAGAGLCELRDALASLIPHHAPAADDGFFYLPIDRAFTIRGQGTVVTGTLRRGPLSVTDEGILLPSNRWVRLRGLQVHGARTATAHPGQRVAANLRDIDPADLPRGTALAPPGLLDATSWLSVTLTAVASAPPLPNGARLTLLAATMETAARLRLLDRDELLPGSTALAQLHTSEPVSLPARERFILRRPSPPATIAGGRILDPAAHRLRRTPQPRLAALATATPTEIVQREVANAGSAGIATLRLARLAGLSPARAIAEAGPGTIIAGQTAVLRTAYETLTQTIPAILSEFPEGLPRDQLAARLPPTNPAVLEAALATLARQNIIQTAGTLIRHQNADRNAARAAQEAAAAQKLADLLRASGLTPPDPATLMPPPLARRLTDRLVRENLAIRTFDVVQKREIIFHRDAIDLARRRLAPHLAPAPGLRVGEAGALLGISRKYAVPLLEHFDAIHFTRREGDRRRLAIANGLTTAR
jgi:selenocysteine-specific elongation factor